MAEFHAVLVRTDSLKAVGGLDERCPTAFEHNDLCLSLEARGGTVPRAARIGPGPGFAVWFGTLRVGSSLLDDGRSCRAPPSMTRARGRSKRSSEILIGERK